MLKRIKFVKNLIKRKIVQKLLYSFFSLFLRILAEIIIPLRRPFFPGDWFRDFIEISQDILRLFRNWISIRK